MVPPRIRPVTSPQNSRVKQLRSALLRPGRADGLIGLEGVHLVEEALDSGIVIETVFVRSSCQFLLADRPFPPETELLAVADDVFASAVSTESPQPLAALARAPRFGLDDLFGAEGRTPLIVIAAGLQDPGNLGTLVRSAEAFAATGMALLPGTVSPWNPKTLRASSGSAFRLPVVSCTAEELRMELRTRGVRLLAAVPRGADSAYDLAGPVALLIGNEGAGLSREWIDAADARIPIPCPGRTESLNAAVAGSILLYEASRQRASRI